MLSHYWHGTGGPCLEKFSKGPRGESFVHLGTLAQAIQRSCGAGLHLVRFDPGKVQRLRGDHHTAGDMEKIARRARVAGKTSLAYLNRYEGVLKAEQFALLDHTNARNIDPDRMPESQLRKLCPSARDSVVVLYPETDIYMVSWFASAADIPEDVLKSTGANPADYAAWARYQLAPDAPQPETEPMEMSGP